MTYGTANKQNNLTFSQSKDAFSTWLSSKTLNFACYYFNDSGNDENYSKHSLIPLGSPTFASGLLNNCTVLNGTSQYWYYNDDSFFEPGIGDFTACGWFWYNSYGTYHGLFMKSPTSNPDNLLEINMLFLGGDQVLQQHVGATSYQVRPTTFPTGQWVFYYIRRISGALTAGFCPASTGTFNPTITINDTNNQSIGVNTSVFRVGAGQFTGTTYWWNGKIDQFIWMKDYGMTNSDLAVVYNNGLGIEGSGTPTPYNWDLSNKNISIWRMNELSGTASEQFGVHNLTVAGTITYSPGIVGITDNLQANASSHSNGSRSGANYLYHTTHADFIPGTGDFTLCGWFNLTHPVRAGLYTHYIVSKNIEQGTNVLYLQHYPSSYGFQGAAGSIGVELPEFPQSEWVFMFLKVRNGIATTGWCPSSYGDFNKRVTGSWIASGDAGNNAADFRIGGVKNGSGSDFYSPNGLIDQVIWCKGYGFSDAELSGIYNNGRGTTQISGTVNYTPRNDYMQVWQFNEISGNAMDQMSGYQLNATRTGITYTSGLLNNCALLNGTTQYFWYGDDLQFRAGTGDFTFTGWYYLTGAYGTFYILMSKGDWNNANTNLGIEVDGRIRLAVNGALYWSSLTDLFPRNKWVFVYLKRTSGVINCGISYDTTFKQFVLGVTDSGVFGDNTFSFRIGNITQLNGTGQLGYFAGKVDQCIWRKGLAFTDSQLSQLFNNGSGTENIGFLL